VSFLRSAEKNAKCDNWTEKMAAGSPLILRLIDVAK